MSAASSETSAPSPAREDLPPASQPGLRRRVATAAILCGMFVAAIELTIVGTAMPRIAGSLGGSDRFTWVLSIYLLSTTVSAPLSGKLSDLLGRKPVYLGAMALFLVGSVLCGAAPTMNFLIAARALQGIGGGALNTAALTLIGDLYTPVERGRVQGLFSAVWGTAGAIGPFVGGLLVDGIGWRWVFYLNLPFGLAAMGLLAWALHERVEKRSVKLDLAGTALLSAGVLALQLAGGAGEGAHGGPAVPRSWALAAAVASIGAFVLVERKTPEPLVPVSLLRNRVVSTTLLSVLVSGAAMFALTNFVPLYAQGVLGASAREAGAILAPFSIAWPLAGVIVGAILTRADIRLLARVGMALVLVGCALPLGVRVEAPGAAHALLLASSALFGVGMGIANTAMLVALQGSVRWEERGTATAAFSFCRTMGGALGVVLAGAVQAARLSALGVSSSTVDAALRPGAPPAAEPLRVAIAHGVRGAFVALAAMGVVAFVAILAYPRVSLARDTSSPPPPLE